MKAVKVLKFTYLASEELQWLLEEFRLMCNDAVRVALKEKPKDRFSLIMLVYERLKEYRLHSHYIHSACEVAYSIYRNKTRKKNPFIKKPFLKLDKDSYKLDYLLMRIPTKPRHFIYISLGGSRYHRSILAAHDLKRTSVTINGESVVIAFSKDISMNAAQGKMGIDVNERNVTWSDTSAKTEKIDISKVCEIQERYKEIRAKIARRTHKDARIKRELLNKYGKREVNRTTQFLHQITKSIVGHAKENNLIINMEKLTGIRKLYRKGNGQGRAFRGRMNSWLFHEFQRQVDYKNLWENMRKVNYINPRGTSRYCPSCGSRVVNIGDRKLFCPDCDLTWDRDDLASKNIRDYDNGRPLVRAARPPECSDDSEPRRQSAAGNPMSKRVEV